MREHWRQNRKKIVNVRDHRLTTKSQLGNADLLSGIRTSFIGQNMETAYRHAGQDQGKSRYVPITRPRPLIC